MYTPSVAKLLPYGLVQSQYVTEPTYEYVDNRQDMWTLALYGDKWSVTCRIYTLFLGTFISEDFFDQLMIAVGYPIIPPSEITTDMDISSGNGYPSRALRGSI